MTNWTKRLLDLARHVAGWSKDPNTHVGALAVDDARRIVEMGYNGPPRKVGDYPTRFERPQKYLWIAHAEENLVAHAARPRLQGTTVYITHLCCCRCARLLINAGVSTVVVGTGTTSMPQEEFDVAIAMLNEARVKLEMNGETVWPPR